MASKNDLSTFKASTASKGVLASVPKQIGRPKAEEKRTFKVTLSLTEAEGEMLKRKAGIAPLATLLLVKLYETDVFKDY